MKSYAFLRWNAINPAFQFVNRRLQPVVAAFFCLPGGEGGIYEGNDERGINGQRGALIMIHQGLSFLSQLR